jgi:hypothetical protein
VDHIPSHRDLYAAAAGLFRQMHRHTVGRHRS